MSHFAQLSDADWYAERGRLLTEMGRPREALAEWERARACAPDDATTHCYLAGCHCDLGEYEVALRHVETAMHLAPEYSWAHRMHYYVLGKLGRGDEALQAAGQAATLAPDSPLALDCLACALLEANRPEDARVIAWRLTALAPGEARSWEVEARVAHAQVRTGDREAATRQALNLNPQSVYGLWSLAETRWHEKRYRESFQAYDDVLLVAPQDNKMQNLVESRLQERIYSRDAVVLFAIARLGLALLAWQSVFAGTGRWYCALLSSFILILTGLPISCSPYWYAFLWRRAAFLEIPRAARQRWWRANLIPIPAVTPPFFIGLFAIWLVLMVLLSIIYTKFLGAAPKGIVCWSMLWFTVPTTADILLTVYLDRTQGMTKGW